MTRCPSCPAPSEATCLAHATGHLRYCDWATRDKAHRAYIRERSHVGTPVVSASEQIDTKLIASIETCDFRRSDCNCLSKPARCLQAGYPAVVTRSDCESCLRATPSPK